MEGVVEESSGEGGGRTIAEVRGPAEPPSPRW